MKPCSVRSVLSRTAIQASWDRDPLPGTERSVLDVSICRSESLKKTEERLDAPVFKGKYFEYNCQLCESFFLYIVV